jgi:amidase
MLAWLGVIPFASIAGLSGRLNGSSIEETQAGADEEVAFLSLHDLSLRIAAGTLSPLEVTRFMLDRIARVDPDYHCYATVMREQAIQDAQSAEREIRAGRRLGPLHGVPVAVKDLCFTKGVRTMGGCGAYRSFVPDVDGTVVAKLRAAGAVILGKTNLTEGAFGGYNPEFGVPLNPWDKTRWPGLSSSGSGAAAAAGLCFAAIGTDTGGSIRFPSAANGVAGLKPTYGRVSRFGVLPFAESLDHVGPMARRVIDVALMLEAIAGRDPRDPTSLNDPVSPLAPRIGDSVAGLRLGIDRKYALAGIDPGEAASIEQALPVFSRLGVQIVEVEMPPVTGARSAWSVLASSEAAAAHARTFPSKAELYGPYARDFLTMGRSMTPEKIQQAQAARRLFTAGFGTLLNSIDAMICPSGGSPAWPVTHELQVGPAAPLHAAWAAALPRSMDFTAPMDLAGTPSICLPSGFSKEGLPYSLQLAGRRLSEPLLCRLAHAYEQATPWHLRHPRLA